MVQPSANSVQEGPETDHCARQANRYPAPLIFRRALVNKALLNRSTVQRRSTARASYCCDWVGFYYSGYADAFYAYYWNFFYGNYDIAGTDYWYQFLWACDTGACYDLGYYYVYFAGYGYFGPFTY